MVVFMGTGEWHPRVVMPCSWPWLRKVDIVMKTSQVSAWSRFLKKSGDKED